MANAVDKALNRIDDKLEKFNNKTADISAGSEPEKTVGNVKILSEKELASVLNIDKKTDPSPSSPVVSPETAKLLEKDGGKGEESAKSAKNDSNAAGESKTVDHKKAETTTNLNQLNESSPQTDQKLPPPPEPEKPAQTQTPSANDTVHQVNPNLLGKKNDAAGAEKIPQPPAPEPDPQPTVVVVQTAPQTQTQTQTQSAAIVAAQTSAPVPPEPTAVISEQKAEDSKAKNVDLDGLTLSEAIEQLNASTAKIGNLQKNLKSVSRRVTAMTILLTLTTVLLISSLAAGAFYLLLV